MAKEDNEKEVETTKAKQPKTKTYVLRAGQEHNGFDEDGVRHTFVGGQKGNDRVELTEVQAKAFADKFDSLEELQARAKAHEEDGEAEDGAETNKKPTPAVGTAEPTPANVTPAPVGSTPDPVNQAPVSPAQAVKK